MNEEIKQPDIEEGENNMEEAATEPLVEDVLPEEPLPEVLLPEENDEPFANVELPDDELTLEDEFPSELDLGEDDLDFETEGEMILIIASDESVTIDDGEQAIEAGIEATTEAITEGETLHIIALDESVTIDGGEQPIEVVTDATTEAVAGTTGEPEAVEEQITATREELKPAIESLLFVADEPLPFKQLCKVMGDVPEEDVLAALHELGADYEARSSGLEVREIAGGWRISTRPQNHEFIRKYLKSRPSARLSLPALETLAVIAYKQPITIPEILEIRGVSSSTAIKTLLEKRLIVTKGRKETVGKPMLYGTSKEFLIQFGLKDLTELPSIEDFEDLSQ